MMSFAFALNRTLRSFGYEVRRYDYANPGFQAEQALRDSAVKTVLDVGANRGQYATSVRRVRPDVTIHSFEPLPEPFESLAAASAGVSTWWAHNCALGRETTVLPMTISRNDESSSLLQMEPELLLVAPQTEAVRSTNVPVRRLDSFTEIGSDLFLKIDAQGYEGEVLAGATETLRRARYVQLEVSMTPLYQGAPRPSEILKFMEDVGFVIHTITPVFSDRRTNRMMQADILFSR